MVTKQITYKMYSLRTPKYMEGKDIEVTKNGIEKSHFEKDVIINFFQGLKLLDEKYHVLDLKLSHIDYKCSMTFIDFNKLDNDYIHVTFETDRYGKERPIKDNKRKIKDKKLSLDESVPEDINFIINLRYGLLFVSRDLNTIINKDTLNTFFNKYRYILYDYITKWNKVNDKTNFRIYRQPPIKVDLVPNMKFFEEIDKLSRVTDFSYRYDPTDSKDVPKFNDLDIMKKAGFKENTFRETRTFNNIFNKASISMVKKLFEELSSKSNFDNFYVKGVGFNGKPKTVKPNFSTRSLVIQVIEKNLDNVSNHMEKISEELKIDNPLTTKVNKLIEIQEIDYEFNDEIINKIESKLESNIEKMSGSEKNGETD